uniref:Uncharacterized protein n=1 Tax=Leptobrachium leishanense TaxID=445787 RepID=A0A8C5LVP0_9ANUR
MSLVIRQPSWEGPETTWMGLSSSITVHDTLCCHGLTAENVTPAMEGAHEDLPEEQKESLTLFTDSCIFNGSIDPDLQDLDENDNLGTAGLCASADPSVADTAKVSISREDPNFSEVDAVIRLEETASKTIGIPVEMGSESEKFENGINSVEAKQTIADEDYVATSDEIDKGYLNVLKSVLDPAADVLLKDTDVGEMSMPGVQLIYSAVIAQQRRKSDVAKDELRNNCNVVLDDHSGPCAIICSPSFSEMGPQGCFGECSLGPSRTTKENGIQNTVSNVDLNTFDKKLVFPNTTEPVQCLQITDHGAISITGYDHVRLRRKKV